MYTHTHAESAFGKYSMMHSTAPRKLQRLISGVIVLKEGLCDWLLQLKRCLSAESKKKQQLVLIKSRPEAASRPDSVPIELRGGEIQKKEKMSLIPLESFLL